MFNIRLIYSYIEKSAGNPGRIAYYTGYAAYLLLDFDPMIPAPMIQPPFVRASMPEKALIEDILEVSLGLIETALIMQTPNATECVGNLTTLNGTLHNLTNMVHSHDFAKLGEPLSKIVALVNPVALSCYRDSFDYLDVMKAYWRAITHPKTLGQTLKRHAWDIYDAATSLVEVVRNERPSTDDYWTAIGNYTGVIFS